MSIMSISIACSKFFAEGRNRTDTGFPPLDFESSASTNFTTSAGMTSIIYAYFFVK